jgi:hypothetical protein
MNSTFEDTLIAVTSRARDVPGLTDADLLAVPPGERLVPTDNVREDDLRLIARLQTLLLLSIEEAARGGSPSPRVALTVSPVLRDMGHVVAADLAVRRAARLRALIAEAVRAAVPAERGSPDVTYSMDEESQIWATPVPPRAD